MINFIIRLFRRKRREPSKWQKIFMLSRVNGAFYDGDKLPDFKWRWPH